MLHKVKSTDALLTDKDKNVEIDGSYHFSNANLWIGKKHPNDSGDETRHWDPSGHDKTASDILAW